MNLFQQMMTFLEVAKMHSFTQAADKLAITPTAVSKQIKALEDQLIENTKNFVNEISALKMKLFDILFLVFDFFFDLYRGVSK